MIAHSVCEMYTYLHNMYMYVVLCISVVVGIFCKIDHCIHMLRYTFMELGHNNHLAESHI